MGSMEPMHIVTLMLNLHFFPDVRQPQHISKKVFKAAVGVAKASANLAPYAAIPLGIGKSKF